MKLVGLLKDRRRSQRGSVLSGVLIMTAFIAILAGALMTELSTNFIVSNDLMNRAANEATVTSAVELSLSQLQATPLYSPCPNLTQVTVNNRTAVATNGSCWPTVDAHWSGPQFQTIATSVAFTVDATQPTGLNDYLIGNSGWLFDYGFGSTSPRWTLPLNATLQGPPLVIANPARAGHFVDVIPLSGSACSPGQYCIEVRDDTNTATTPPSQYCLLGGNGPMVSEPAPSQYRPGYFFYWDGTYLQASDASGSDCDYIARTLMPSSQPIVAGPLVLCTSGCSGGDNLYVAISDNNSSELVWFTFNGGLTQRQVMSLPWGNVTGIAASGTDLTRGATLAVSFKSGGVTLVSVASSGALVGSPISAAIAGGVADAPYWCGTACGNLVGVGGQNAFYLYDASLHLVAAFFTPSQITTTPSADGAGFWYVATNDGNIRELQYRPGQGLTQLTQYSGPVTQFGSSPQVGPCSTGICIYSAGVNGTAYLLTLDARDAVISACLSTSPPACSGINPRLWAQVEIGIQGNTKAVHVQGWSYYSP